MNKYANYATFWKRKENVGVAESMLVHPSLDIGQEGNEVTDRESTQSKELLERLLRKYQNYSLEDAFPRGAEKRVDGESCFHIRTESVLKFTRPSEAQLQSCFLSTLKFIRGIGEYTETKLKKQGYKILPDLISYPQYSRDAISVYSMYENMDIQGLLNYSFHRFKSPSDPSILSVSGLVKLEDLLFMDIETLGLAGVPVILVGVGLAQGGDRFIVDQYLLREIGDEYATLLSYLKHIHNHKVLLTYNGRSFDVPFLDSRMVYNGIPQQHDIPHFDLMHFSRRMWKDTLPDCTLKTIEAHLTGSKRVDDVPGSMVPCFYRKYLETLNPGPLVPIVEHNKLDIIHLANIYMYICGEWFNED